MKKFFRDTGLSLVLAACFITFWFLQSVFGYRHDTNEREKQGAAILSYTEYLTSGHFWQATGENWESEFLQMGAYVFLTSFLFQRGSTESKDPDEKDEGDEPVEEHLHDAGRLAILDRGQAVRWIYKYSLGLAFLLLFTASFALHAWGGYAEHRALSLRRGEAPGGFWDFIGGSEFWFQSMQNWQSEFLAVLAIVVLSIWLRHHGSPESKPVWAPHRKTGKE